MGVYCLSDTQQLEGLGDQITVLEFKVDDIYRRAKFSTVGAGRRQRLHGHQLMEQNKALFRSSAGKLVTLLPSG